MQLIPFSSPEEMQSFLSSANSAAHASLHPVQRALTVGNHWVRFVDIAARIVEFGYILTPTETYEVEIAAGANTVDARAAAAGVGRLLDNGYMYGKAWSPLGPDGEYGITHKAHVWPIESTVALDAAEHGWRVDELSLPSKINLQAAFNSLRAHVRSL